MCLAIPGKVVSIKNKKVVVDYVKEKRTANNLFIDDLKINDYVVIQNDFVVEKINKNNAIKIIRMWKNARRKNEN